MRAEQFYQTTNVKTVPLILLTKAQCSSDLHEYTMHEQNSLAVQQFVGDIGNIGIIYSNTGLISKIYVGTGAGDKEALAIASVVNRLPHGSYTTETPLSHAAMVAWSLAQYQFDRYKTAEPTLRTLVITKQDLPSILAEASAVFLVRDLINTPTNDMGPQDLAEVVSSLADEFNAEFKQWVGEELLQNNFPAIHAVGRASSSSPRLLSLVWGQENHPKVTLVGKGVCFDSGGLDIKQAAEMRLMKKDMGGAAQVIGLAQWLMTHRVPIRLQVLIPAVENAVGSDAYRPGDVLTMRNGLKVEVHNTDAEGRLVLADALVKAVDDQPELIIDFATLTGAARVAVGTEIAAMFVNHDQLAQDLALSAMKTNDHIWRMPLYDGYEGLFDSTIADFTNASASPYAGAITAALFLQRFIPAHIPWVHFDIMAWNVSSKPGKPEGGEAMGIRAVGQYLISRYSD